jgi:hypothetical protein
LLPWVGGVATDGDGVCYHMRAVALLSVGAAISGGNVARMGRRCS